MEKNIERFSKAELINYMKKEFECALIDFGIEFEKNFEYHIIDFVIEEGNRLSDEIGEKLLKNIDFDDEKLYEVLADYNMIAEDIMSVPKLAEKVNHYHIWFYLPISFTIDEDTTLEEYKDYIYDELGLDVEDYLIEERYNCIIEDLKNED